MLPFLFGVFVSFGLLVASPHMSKEEEAIVFAMKGMSEAGFVHKTKKGKKPTLKDYGNAVKDYRVAKTGTGKRPSDSALSRLLSNKKKVDKRIKKTENRGVKSKVTAKHKRRLFTILRQLEKKNKGRDVTARMLKEVWEKELPFKVSGAANERFEFLEVELKVPIARATEFSRVCSRLYRSPISQVNTRWRALAEIYTMHPFKIFCNLNFFR